MTKRHGVDDSRQGGLVSGDKSCQKLAVDLLQISNLSLGEVDPIFAANGLYFCHTDAAWILTLHEVIVQGNRRSLAALLAALDNSY